MADFSNVKVGDKIKYYSRWWGNAPHFATVTKVAPKHFEDSKKVKFRKSDGVVQKAVKRNAVWRTLAEHPS